MRKNSTALFLALLMGAGLATAADEKGKGEGLGTDPKSVTGASQKGAGATGSGGTGLSASGAGSGQNANQSSNTDQASNGQTSGNQASGGQTQGGQASGGQHDGSGMAYIDCPGNAFSGGIRNDPQGRDCVQPDSAVIQGGDNMTRGDMIQDRSRSVTSGTVAGDTDTGTNAKVPATSGNRGGEAEDQSSGKAQHNTSP